MDNRTVARRTLLAGVAGGAAAAASLTLAGCSVPVPPAPVRSADPAPGRPIATNRRALLLQVAAHPDDDLFFMNPDTQRLLDAGVPVVSVYVTAGEHNGRNGLPGKPPVSVDKAAYSAARHQGLRQAYAEALGLNKFTAWQRRSLGLAGGRHAEADTLEHAGRRVELVFLNLPMHHPRHSMAVPALWEDRALELRTQLSAGSPVLRSDTYDHDRLVEVLAGLFAAYRPTVVHTLDPDPDIQHGNLAAARRDSEQPGYSDHGDHTAVACFTWAALLRWVADATAGGGPVPAFTTTAFRGYYNRHWPKNLPPRVLAEKAAHLVPYGGDPSWDCGDPSGCGDYGQGGGRPLTNRKGWVRATHHRWPGARPVLAGEPDGRLAAYGVLGLRMARWRETAPRSGVWGEPTDLGGGPLTPALGQAILGDGRLLLFGVRISALSGRGGPDRREVVLLEQRSTGGEFSAWRGLGNPERGDDRGRRIGAPVAVAAPDGRVHLFVRNADKGVSTRVRSADGAWGPWRTLPGSGEASGTGSGEGPGKGSGEGVQDGLTALVDGAGRVRLLAAGRTAVRQWVDGSPAAPLPLAGDPVAAVPGPGPRDLAVYYRAPAEGRLRVAPGAGVRPVPAFEGYGALAAAPGPVLLGLDDHGRVQLHHNGRLSVRTRGATPVGDTALWMESAGGGALAVGMGADARPWIWRPPSPSA
ncbi:PIG-L family deacetylase [Streptomyces sp. NPDC048718]|uniref:PIG-L family deacetylase n=1 Tax=Streptomyces sp. NPDC048718 TaxID=3365587 RepID=UPI00371A68A6